MLHSDTCCKPIFASIFRPHALKCRFLRHNRPTPLVTNCRFPFFLLVTMRGELGEGNPWQIPMGSTTQDMLELAGFQVFRAAHPEDAVVMVTEGLKMAWRSDAPVAVLLSQRLIGAKDM
jgi:sulfopyruvate decarboxylase TPP-binding subunit